MIAINSKKVFGMLFVGLAILFANPNLGWAQESYGGGDEYDSSLDEFTQQMDAAGLKVSSIKSSEGNVQVVPTSSFGGSQVLQNDIVQKMAIDYANKKAGYHKPGSQTSDAWQTAKEEGLVVASREYTINKQTNQNAQVQKCKELTGRDCKFAKTTFNSEERLRIDSGLWGTWQDFTSSEYSFLLSKIADAGRQAREEFNQSDEVGNPYIGVSEITLIDSTGKKYVVEVKNGKSQGVTYKEGAFKDCEVLPVKLYNQRKCFFCPLFAVIYRAADNMAILGFTKLAGGFAAILALGLGLYIAFQTLTHVSSITKQDAPKFLGTLLRQTFKFLIAFLLLQYSGQVYTYLINPILEAGLSFGTALLTQSTACEASTEVMTTIYYQPSLYASLECFITNVQKEIAFMQTIGTSLMCIGGNAMMLQSTTIDFGDGFWMALQGLLIGGFGFLLSLAFAFYLIDAVVQLGIVGALMPFLIASWPFKLTAQYTSKGFSMILNSFFVFVFVGLVVSVNLQLIDAAMENGAQSAETERKETTVQIDDKTETVEEKFGALQKLYDAINTQNSEEIKRLTDISGTAFIILLVCCIFGFKFCAQSSSLADKMASGGLKGIGSSIGTMAASAAVSGAKKITKPTRDAIGDRADAAIKAAPGAVFGAPRALFNKLGSKKSGASGENQSGKNEEAKTSVDTTSAKSTGPVTISQNKGNKKPEENENSPHIKRTENANSDANDVEKNKNTELKNEFAQTDLSKALDKEIAQSKAKEDAARQKELEAGGKVKSNSEKLANMSDKNSPEAQGLSASIAADKKQEESAKKEADAEHKKGQALQKRRDAAEKGYVSKRKEGGSVAAATKEATTKASKQDSDVERTQNETKPRQRDTSKNKKNKKKFGRKK